MTDLCWLLEPSISGSCVASQSGSQSDPHPQRLMTVHLIFEWEKKVLSKET